MDAQRVRVWDGGVRAFHWSLVGSFALAWLTSEDAEGPHRWAGYAALALVAFRVLWGFAGGQHARFSDFVPSVPKLLDYLGALARGRAPRHLGHNPAAAMMILFLLGMIGMIGGTGWMMTTDWGWGSEVLEGLHAGAVNLTLVAVAVHVSAAVIESLRHRENLVLAMITGYKRR